MNCYICNTNICEHGRLHIFASGNVECLDCGVITHDVIPIVYALPFYEGQVSWNSKVFFPVCPGCYYKETAMVSV